MQSHMEREQKLLTTHEVDMAQAAQLNERLRTQLEEREAELTHHRDDLKKKVFVLKLVSENIFYLLQFCVGLGELCLCFFRSVVQPYNCNFFKHCIHMHPGTVTL